MTKVHDLGEVVLLDVMGSDQAIGDAARVSYHPASNKQKNSLEGLIRYLMRHKHTSPFEMVEFKFYLKMPIFVARQWIRHRTANLNEMSGRYSIMPDEFYVPHLDEIGYQSDSNKQGTGDVMPESVAASILGLLKSNGEEAFRDYHSMVDDVADGGLGLSKEMARIDLPLSTYTEMIWKIDLHNLLHFLTLRTDSHAQKQIRDYADVLEDFVAATCPMAWQAWRDYHKYGYHASRMEARILADCVSTMQSMAKELGLGDKLNDIILQNKGQMSDRELAAFRAKFAAE